MKISEMVTRAYANSLEKGWHDEPRSALEALALIHSEVSEAVEACRDPDHYLTETWTGTGGKPEGLASELADVVIRVGDLCGELGIDLEAEIERKMRFNSTRPHRHGGKRA